MQTAYPIIALATLAGCTELPVCPLLDEHHIGPDEAGPDGFSANDVLALVGGVHLFDAATDPDYPDFPTGVSGGVTVTVGDRRGRPWVREWTCTPPTLFVPVDVRVTSEDGALDVEGEMEIGGTTLAGESLWWSVSSMAPLDGVVPDALVGAAAVEQGDHCPEDADEEPTVRVFLSGGVGAAKLNFDAQYAHHRVCNYASVLASASLVPR